MCVMSRTTVPVTGIATLVPGRYSTGTRFPGTRVGYLEGPKAHVYAHLSSFNSFPMTRPMSTGQDRLAFHSKLS